jgi:hypothetical protein
MAVTCVKGPSHRFSGCPEENHEPPHSETKNEQSLTKGMETLFEILEEFMPLHITFRHKLKMILIFLFLIFIFMTV